MLERVEHSNGVVTYQSPLLCGAGVPHGFSTRIGGFSKAPFDALNLGNPSGCEQQDTQPNLVENYKALQEAIGAAGMLRAWVHQVHGRMVELVEHEPENEYGETLEAEIRDRFSGQTQADAIVTGEPNVLLTIRVADCVPVLLASEDGRMVGAAHAGWRGIVGPVIAKTVRTLHEEGASPEKLVAAIGPCISVEHFEVGEEVAAEFMQQDLAMAVKPQPGKKPHLDLQLAVKVQLERAGVTRIDTHNLCTFRDATEFYSHRRDNGVTGRMAAVIACRVHDKIGGI
jgi:YfiH family protein